MAGQITHVHVLDGRGKRVCIEAETYRAHVDAVVRPVRGKAGEREFTVLSGRGRAKAIQNQITGHLQETGELFPTE